jgi:glycosyltransferase involved in cell wall biosynthesis
MRDSPGIDVVVPTLNCSVKLRKCLARLRAQDYPGGLHIIVVDGGSTDDSAAVAQEFGATVFVNPGQYLAGLEGARRFGELHATRPLVWNVDADNFLVEDTCASRLAQPLMDDPTIQFSFPDVSTDPTDSRFNNYLALEEHARLERVEAQCRPFGPYFVTDDCRYGLTNATLIRRQALESAGGYDSDVLLLRRLRALGLAKAAFVSTAHFTHSQTQGAWDYREKWLRRARLYAGMPPAARTRYFSTLNQAETGEPGLTSHGLRLLWGAPKEGLREFARSGDPIWLNGVVLATMVTSIFLAHPVVARRALTMFQQGGLD